MTAPACRKGLRRKNGRKANFRQVQTSAARSFGSQSNQIINTASAPKRAPLPSPIHASGGKATRSQTRIYPQVSPRNWRSQYPGSRDGGPVANWIPDIR